jgi:serine/threonine protein kinase
MAEIFLARGVSTTGVERYCVLKRILRDRATDVHFVRMFLDEARLAAQLQHPNVAQVYDIGKLGDSYFFTMEYVHGETIRAILHRARGLRREVPHGAIMTVIAGAAAGLHHAHARIGHDGRPLGIVHRDVSPSNLMVSYEGGVKVVDFGVAKAENRAQETRSGTVKGKIAYLSPEQCRGAPIDRRSDLFSLGIIMWEMLTTERLYKRNSDFENMTAIVTEEPTPPSARRASIPPELDAIALRLLAKDPNVRFQSGDELVEALEEAASRIGSMISSAGLGRFLREMFGQRPEPWLEMDQTHEVPAEGVTVTSEPIPKELAVPAAQSMDLKLSHVPDLRASRDSSQPLPSSQLMTAPAIPVAAPPMETMRGLPLPAPPPSGVVPPGRSQPPSVPPPIPGAAAYPNVASTSGAHAYPNVASSSGSIAYPNAPSSSGANAFPSGSHGSYPIVDRPQQPQDEPHREHRSWPLVAVVAALAIGGSLTVWAVMRSGGNSSSRDAAVAKVAADASMVITINDDATEVAEADAFVVAAADAEVAEVPADAAAVVRVPPDAAAAPVRDELEIAMTERRYTDVVAACTAKVTAEHAASCTLAACHMKQETKARQWYARMTGGRRTVINACRDLNVDLVPRPKPPTTTPRDAGVNDCVVNPMACQH